jgi:hypothetical protein
MAHSNGWHGITRRGFLLGAAAGGAAGAAATWYGDRYLPSLLRRLGLAPFSGQPAEDRRPALAMPGRYPGRVVEVRNPNAVGSNHKINAPVVGRMIDTGMASLTGADPGDIAGAWGQFFNKDDVVGIKVNPVGRKAIPKDNGGRLANAVGCISSPTVLVHVVDRLTRLGIPPKNIIVFERYADEFCDAGYADVVERELPRGVRWYASSQGYSPDQLDVTGFDGVRHRLSPDIPRHIAGYDPDVFTVMGYCLPEHSPRDDRRFRSHLSAIVTRMVSKIITLPVLKDHRSAGVTLALKNMSHGMNNNVSRSHLSGIAHGFGKQQRVNGPNQCNTFIPQAVSQLPLCQKATLHILDGLIGVYEGGPGCWNRTWGTWHHQGLFFATDPVALDHVGWDIIDSQRAQMGWAPVGNMGWVHHTPEVQVSTHLAALAASSTPQALSLIAAGQNREAGRASEAFNLRQPEHIILAGELGLGVFPREEISHQVVSRQ